MSKSKTTTAKSKSSKSDKTSSKSAPVASVSAKSTKSTAPKTTAPVAKASSKKSVAPVAKSSAKKNTAPVAKSSTKKNTAPVAAVSSKSTVKIAVQKRGRLTISEKLSAVQQRLRTGDQTAIASMTGYHITHVNRVLKGRRGNPSGVIVQAAYSLVGKRKVNA